MKITLILLLSVVTFVACNIPEPFSKPLPPGCWCKKKDCTDVSCEEKACLCLVDAIKRLLKQENLKYPKKWLEYYLELLQYRCLCLKRCQNICTPKDYLECVKHVFKVFDCKYAKFLAGIKGDKGYAEFVKDIQRILRECLKKDCKPICSGKTDCNSFHIPPKHCGCTQKCIDNGLEEVFKCVDNPDALEKLSELQFAIQNHMQQYTLCENIKKETQRAVCHEYRENDFEKEYQRIIDEIIAILGTCSGLHVASIVQQIGNHCAYKSP